MQQVCFYCFVIYNSCRGVINIKKEFVMSIGGMSGAGWSGWRLSPEGLSGRVDGLESGML